MVSPQRFISQGSIPWEGAGTSPFLRVVKKYAQMAFNRRNLYKRIIEVQEVALPEWERGVPFSVIYKRHIKDRFHISERTFETYLGIPVKQKIKELESKEKKEKQPSLFD